MYKLIIIKASYSDTSDTAMCFETYEQAKEYETELKNTPFNHVVSAKIVEVK